MLHAFHSASGNCDFITGLLRRAASLSRRSGAFILSICCLLLLWTSSSIAQDVKYAQNAADNKQRSSVHVDPSTLSMQLQIPLGSYPGRGGADVPITLYYSPKLWRMDYVASYINEGFSTYRPVYGEGSASGWTSSLDWFKWPSTNGRNINGVDNWLEKYDLSGNPVSTVTYSRTVGRIHVILPDGSRHELRRSDTVLAAGSDTTTGTFYAVDGSRLRYESASRTLFIPDGSRLIYAADVNGVPTFIYYIDRNGNQNVYSYATGQWTDSLGRTFNVPPLNNSTVGDYSYQVPGVGGTTLSYTFRWRSLSTVLTDMSQPLRYVGDHTWNYPYGMSGNPALFTSPDDEKRVIANSTVFNPVVLYQIVLPNNQTYTFTYNVWGEINKIVYPTGAYETFSYNTVEPLSGHIDDELYSQTNRGVTSRSVSPSGQGGDNQNWSYGTALDTSVTPYRLMRAITNPDGSYEQILYHTGRGNAIKYGFEDARAGKAFDERLYTADPNLNPAATMLRRTLTEWTYDGPQPFDNNSTATRNARPQKTIQILLDTVGLALAATTTYQYDADLNVISTSQYDYAQVPTVTAQTGASTSIPQGALVRTSEATYLVNDTAIASTTRTAYRNRNLIGLLTSTRIRNSAGTIVAQSSMSYDEAAYPLISIGAVTGWTDPATTVRGNATTASRWLDATGTYLQSHVQYDQCGNPTNAWDAKGNLSQTQYSSTYQYAYPTHTISPIPGSPYGSTTAFETSTAYDSSTGLVTSTTDANGQTTSYQYNDPLNRLSLITRPTGGGSTTYSYNDVVGSFYVRTQTTQSASVTLNEYQYFDGLGRPSRSFQYENSDPANVWLTSDTQYDVMNRVWRVSNPYRSSGSASAINPSGYWTTTSYDVLSRVTSATTADNAAVVTSYNGNKVTVTDQAGKARSSVTDALGRLTQVIEDPNGLAYQTNYTYDALGNLRMVAQGQQRRYFMYDSLSRLTRAKNPEHDVNASLAVADPLTANSQWSMSYGYDANSNMTTRTDARGAVTTYAYDALNRNTTVRYAVGVSGATDTPGIDRYYDGATNGKGRLWKSQTLGPLARLNTIDSYDALGRPLTKRQQFYYNLAWSQPYTVQRTYDYVGHVTTQTYPSGHTVNYQYDQAGRVNNFSGNLGIYNASSTTYASEIIYDAAGKMLGERFGTTPNSPYHTMQYNLREQLWDVSLGHGNRYADDLGWLFFFYTDSYLPYADSTHNNGNVLGTEGWSWLPGYSGWEAWRDDYTYDSLNRITSVVESTYKYVVPGSATSGSSAQSVSGPQAPNHMIPWSPVPTFTYQYSYDQYGNRTAAVRTAPDTNTGQQFTVDSATNRHYAPGDINHAQMSYDAAGNLVKDFYTSNGLRAYDAENRMVGAAASGGSSVGYEYDADGNRVVQSLNGRNGWYIHGMDGELLVVYPEGAPPTPPYYGPLEEYGYRAGQLLVTATDQGLVHWLVPDHLGTPRIIVDNSDRRSRHDYLPFGEELYAGTGGRTSSQGYNGFDGVRQKFTGKQRDYATELDYFIARYYSSTQGRFTSTDPLYFQMMMAIDPQRLNLYAYGRNNPLKWTDPTGERLFLRGNADWLRTSVLYEMAGGQEAFDQYFEINDGQVMLRSGADLSNVNSGIQLLAELVNSSDNYLYYAGTNGREAAGLFQGTFETNKRGELKITNAGRSLASRFEGTISGESNSEGSIVRTSGRGVPNDPANLANGDPVFAVIAYNTGLVQTQEAVSIRYPVAVGAQNNGLYQIVRPVSMFIHESAENLVFARQGGRFDYKEAHTAAMRREALIRGELKITGGFAGGGVIHSNVRRR